MDVGHENIEVVVLEDTSVPLEPIPQVNLDRSYGVYGRDFLGRLRRKRGSGSSESSCASHHPPSEQSKSPASVTGSRDSLSTLQPLHLEIGPKGRALSAIGRSRSFNSALSRKRYDLTSLSAIDIEPPTKRTNPSRDENLGDKFRRLLDEKKEIQREKEELQRREENVEKQLEEIMTQFQLQLMNNEQ